MIFQQNSQKNRRASSVSCCVPVLQKNKTANCERPYMYRDWDSNPSWRMGWNKTNGSAIEIRVASQYTSPNCHFPIYLICEPIFLAGSAMRANLPHMTVPKYQFTSFGSVAEPIYLLPEVPSQFTSSARRLSVVAGVLSEMLLSRIWSLSGCMLG